MTNPQHTDISRSGVNPFTAPKFLVGGALVPPSKVTFFGGDSLISLGHDGTLELGSKWEHAGDAAMAFFNALTEHVVPSWNARIEDLEAENKRLREALDCIAERPGEGVEYLPGHGDVGISEARHMELIARAALDAPPPA